MARGTIEIFADRCKGCQLCVAACPKNLIHVETDHVNARGYYPVKLVDPENACTGCAICAMACPDVSIKVYRMPRAAGRPREVVTASV
ncbi:MAG: 4Fe-4S binding protein [Anaerolineae bacterium]|nr:4Fe-4S binding protein [Anaerolineae bacterium]